MATGALISVSEYLNTSYRPDRDYIEGEVRERNLGEREHARLQTAIATWFGNRNREWNIDTVVEQRIQVSARRFRVPDVSVLSRDQPMEPIVRVPSIICCEVLSRTNTLGEIRDRCEDYLKFGVPHVWVFEPLKRQAFVCDSSGIHAAEVNSLTVTGTPICLPLQQVFAELD